MIDVVNEPSASEKNGMSRISNRKSMTSRENRPLSMPTMKD